MESKFDFLSALPRYRKNPAMIQRLERRHKLLIDPFIEQIRGARVLDLACHDGRWSYALAQAGARKVIGVEARKDLLDSFKQFADTEVKARVKLECSDMLSYLVSKDKKSTTFDVVALYGIFYHTLDHMQLLRLISGLNPKIIIIDSEFVTVDNAIIQVLWEETSNPLNAIVPDDKLGRTVVGVPSIRAMEFMAEAIGYEVTWLNAGLILGDDREGMDDYFRKGRKARSTCVLTRREIGASL